MNTLVIVVLASVAVLASAKPYDDGQWHGHWADGGWGHHDVVHGHGATIIGPAAGHAVIAGPVAHGGWGHGWAGHHGGHGVAVVGPHTVPATIVGPSGKIVADGLYGVGHGHHVHGHHW